MTVQPKSPRESLTTSSTVVMPEETNNHGGLFGGALVSHIDRIAAIAAIKHCRQLVVTASIDRLDFLAPARGGDFVHFDARVTFTARTSMELRVHVETEKPLTGVRNHICEAYLTFVAIGADGRPASGVPALALETDEDRSYFAAGKARYEARKAERTAS
ncbi:MAG: acyl-CoA thioesterase [Planctomycetota bacterium]